MILTEGQNISIQAGYVFLCIRDTGEELVADAIKTPNTKDNDFTLALDRGVMRPSLANYVISSHDISSLSTTDCCEEIEREIEDLGLTITVSISDPIEDLYGKLKTFAKDYGIIIPITDLP